MGQQLEVNRQRRWFRFQFGLRSFIVLCLLSAPLIVFVQQKYLKFTEDQRSLRRLTQNGAVLIFEYQIDENGYFNPNAQSRIPRAFQKIHCIDHSGQFYSLARVQPQVTAKTLIKLNAPVGKMQEDLTYFTENDRFVDLVLKGKDIVSLNGIENSPSIRSLKIIDCNKLKDISAVERLPNLKSLELSIGTNASPLGLCLDQDELAALVGRMPNTKFSGEVNLNDYVGVGRKGADTYVRGGTTKVAVARVESVGEAIAACSDESKLRFEQMSQAAFEKFMCLESLRSVEFLLCKIHDFSPLSQLPNLNEVRFLDGFGNPPNLLQLPRLSKISLRHGIKPDEIPAHLKASLTEIEFTGFLKFRFNHRNQARDGRWQRSYDRTEHFDLAGKLPSWRFSDFQSLKILRILNRELVPSIDIDGANQLKSLVVLNCPNVVTIGGGAGLNLTELKLGECDSLATVDLSKSTELTSVMSRDLPQLVQVNLGDVSNLQKLAINYLPQLKRVEGLGYPPIGELECVQCRRLVSIPEPLAPRNVYVRNCFRLRGLDFINEVSSPEVLEAFYVEGNHCEFEFEDPARFTNLNTLSFRDSMAVVSLKDLTEAPSLTSLSIDLRLEDADLVEISRMKKLTTLSIGKCSRFKNLEALRGLKNLIRLTINRCPQLVSLEGLENATDLEFLSLVDCQALTNVSSLAAMKRLDFVQISNCEAIPNDALVWLGEIAKRPKF